MRDGIASYAVQSVAALRAEGHDVEVLSPGPSAAHQHLDLRGPRGGLAVAKRVPGYDRVIVQFHPDVFYPLGTTRSERAQISLAYAAAFARAARVEVVVHEIDYTQGRGHTAEALAARLMWSRVDRVVVHTERERADFVAAFGVGPQRVVVSRHGASFRRRTRLGREPARRSLGIPQDVVLFLAIGFIQPHKGFDRAARAFAGLHDGARLDIVGSVRVDVPAYLAHLDELGRLVEATPGTHLHEGFLSDELFDRWIVAADALVLPYREIWSSGVLERAALYDRQVIATRVGGLAEQAAGRPEVTLVANDEELRAAMWAAAGRPAAVVREPWPVEAADLRAAVQDEIVRRAAVQRGSVLAGPASPGPPPESDGGAELSELSLASAPLRRMGNVSVPAVPASPGPRALVKRAVRRVSAWEVEPVAQQLNVLRAATLEAVERLAGRIAAERSGDAAAGRHPPPAGPAGSGGCTGRGAERRGTRSA
nr:glycosyltransferase family 4 protein [Pseudonocardia acidicola]